MIELQTQGDYMAVKFLLLVFLLFVSISEIQPGQTVNNDFLPFNILYDDTVYYDNFENGMNEWTAQNLGSPTSPSLWKITNLKSVSPSHSIGWYDSTTNSYPHLSYEALISPEILVPSNANSYLSFDVFIHLAPNGSNSTDLFDIEITTNNGNTWAKFSKYAYGGQQIGWKNFPFDFSPGESGDISSFAGQNVKFRFLISTDNLDPNGEGVFIDNFRILKTDCEYDDPFEPNNTSAQAAPISHGQILNAALCPVGDFDYYSFNVSQNDRINIVTEHNHFQIRLELFNPSGTMVAQAGNSLFYNAPVAGEYKLKIFLSDIFNYTLSYSMYLNIINTKPDIISVTDIPGDEGLKVRVQWQYSIFDPPDANGTIKDYHLFRKVNDTTGLREIAINSADINKYNNLQNEIIIEGDEYWDYITTVPAVSPRPFSNYSFTAPTLQDQIPFTFKVAAVSKTAGQPVLWGNEGTGISTDNIAPEFTNFSVSPGTNSISINWQFNSNLYTDVRDVKIYRGMFDRFAPVGENTLTTVNPALGVFTDEQITPGETYYYMLSISDFSENTTYTSILNSSVTSVLEENILPEEFSLKQNYPNPFNPSTVIEFSLPTAGEISLKVYNILGIEITQLAGGSYSPGDYKISFDVNSLNGGLPSGIYFYTLTAGGFSETKKLMLLK